MENTNRHDHLLTVEELAAYARCSTASIYRWIHQGKLVSKRVGHRHLFRATDIEKLLGYVPQPRKRVPAKSAMLRKEQQQ